MAGSMNDKGRDVGTSMAVSRKAGIALALGISTGSFFWASMTAIGLTALIAAYASVLTVIKIIGGLYLLWLAFKSFRSAASTKPIMDPAGLAAVGKEVRTDDMVERITPTLSRGLIISIEACLRPKAGGRLQPEDRQHLPANRISTPAPGNGCVRTGRA